MNSLEALKELKETAIETIRSLSYPVSYLVKEDIEDIEEQANKIKKDLEVLEMLKQLPFYIEEDKESKDKSGIDIYCNWIITVPGLIKTTENIAEMIKEWLEDK